MKNDKLIILQKLLVKASQLVNQPFIEYKEEAIRDFTNGAKSHMRELDSAEISAMIHLLGQRMQNMKTQPKGDRIRKAIFRYCYEMKIITTEMSSQEKIQAINLYIENHSKIGLKKDLNSYSVSELQHLCYQFEVFYKHYLSKI